MSSSINTTTLFSGQGIDVTSAVQQLVTAAEAPETNWQNQQQSLQSQESALNQLNTDLSDLQTSIEALQVSSGALGSVTTSSSNSGVVTATAEPATANSSHLLVVNNLAATSSYYTDPVASSSTQLTDGTSFTIQVGSGSATTITLDSSDDTLSTLASTINSMNLGVTANVITDANGARLAMVANNSGAASDISVSADTTGLNFTKAVTGANASLTVDGVPVSSATNSVTGVVPGVTFNLVGSAPGSEVTVSVAASSSGAAQAINSFVSAYNTAITDLNSQFAYDSGSGTSGPLSADSTTGMVQQELLSFASYAVSGAGNFSTLGSLGITMNNDGTLSVDSTTLNNALTNNYQDVQNFFQSSSGFANYVDNQLNQLTDPTNGAFYLEIKSDQTTYNDLQDQINDLNTYVASEQTQWLAQYNQINVTLQELPLLEQQVNAELGFTNNNNSNSSSNS